MAPIDLSRIRRSGRRGQDWGSARADRPRFDVSVPWPVPLEPDHGDRAKSGPRPIGFGAMGLVFGLLGQGEGAERLWCYSSAMTTSTIHPPFRIGHGYDLHRLEPLAPQGSGRPFVLGGLTFEHGRGPVGHSDGDALLHAVTDALLGALGEDDIGQLFPDTDPTWKGAASTVFLGEAVRRVASSGYRIANIDATIILETPKIGPRKAELRNQLAELLGIPGSQVNLKGKTHEKVDAVGEGRAIEVHVVTLLVAADLED